MLRHALQSTTRPATSRALLAAGVAVAVLGQVGLLAADPLRRPEGEPVDTLSLAPVPTLWLARALV